jgi:uncharacterized protein YkwD
MAWGKHRRSVLCAAVAAFVVVTAIPSWASTAEETSAESRLLSIINTKRVDRGVPKLRFHSYIRYESVRHSTYMSRNGMSHDGFNDRWRRVKQHDGGVRSMCENVAYARNYPSAETAMAAIYKNWYNSSSHYKCLFDRLGFTTRSGAVGIDKVGNTWWATFEAAQDSTPGG